MNENGPDGAGVSVVSSPPSFSPFTVPFSSSMDFEMVLGFRRK